MLKLTLRQMEYVAAVAEAGSLSAAAQNLHVSQPALSVAISQVEAQIGLTLFIRRKGARIIPTRHAAPFVTQIRSLLETAARIEDPRLRRAAAERRLVIGCFHDLAPRWLAPILRQLRSDCPDLTVSHRVADFATLAADMTEGRIDLSLTYDLGLDRSFARTALVTVAPCAFVGADDQLADRQTLTLADLTDRPLVVFDEGLSGRHVLHLFHRQGLTPQIAVRIGTLELMRSFAANGQGVGISYSCPPGDVSYDGRRVVSIPIADAVAAEPIILARSALSPAGPASLGAAKAIRQVLLGKA